MAKTRIDAKPITLTIDDIEVTVPDGTTVLDAAKAAGIYIPYLCAHPALRPWGACRMCTVEIEKARGIPTSCTTPVAQGMVVRTNTGAVQDLRRDVMELILTEHPIGCLSCHKRDQCGPQETCLRSVAVDFRCVTCPANYRCELQLNCDYVGLDEIAMPIRSKNIPLRKDPLIALDWNLCIVCGRCVRVCDEVRVVGVYGMVDRSGKTIIDTAYGGPMADAGCTFCGACVDVCPVGAIEERRNRFAGVADSVAESVCNFCSDGCSFRLEQKRGKVIRVAPIWEAPVNGGMYCVKGRFGTAEPLHHTSRLTRPLVRRNGQLVESTWEEALELVCREFSQRRGSIGVIGSVRTTNEASYLLQKLARTALQTPHIDTTARLSDAPGLLGLFQVLGIGASTTSHDTIGETDLLLVIGDDTTETTPITGMKLLQAVRRQVQVPHDTGYFSYLPDVGVREHARPTLIVIDPRETEVAKYADLWLRPRPGTDRILLTAILNVICQEGLYNEHFIAEHADDFEHLRESVAGCDLTFAEQQTGVPREQIVEAARRYAGSPSALTLFGRGITQQIDGTAAVRTVAALAVVTGQIDRPGAGILQPLAANNARGAFDLGCLPEFLPGYQPAGDVATRDRAATLWGTPPPEPPGLRLLEQLEAARAGTLTALYVVGANPAQSVVGGESVRAALERTEFLVVQDLYLTETGALADVVLPAASFAEQDGTFTNAERLVQRIRQVIDPVGESRPDWHITSEIGRRLGANGFDFVHPREVFEEISRVAPIYQGLNYDLLDDGPQRWPLGGAASNPRRFQLGFEFGPMSVTPGISDGWLVLGIGSGHEHFGTGTQTRLVKEFLKFQSEDRVTIHPEDADRGGILDGSPVMIHSEFGTIRTNAQISNTILPGTAIITNLFPGTGVNRLFGQERDAESGTPATKRGLVRLTPAT